MQGKNQPTTAFARDQGSDEEEATSQLFRRLSLNLMRGNALMLSSRHQDEDIPLPEVDGVEKLKLCIFLITICTIINISTHQLYLDQFQTLPEQDRCMSIFPILDFEAKNPSLDAF